MNILKETQYLRFIEFPKREKTRIIAVMNKHHEEVIGMIKWFARWRQYCFFPVNNTVWNINCLNDVNSVIMMLAEERKKKKATIEPIIMPKRKSYDEMTLEELEVELQEVWDKGDNTEEEFNMLIVPLENRIKTIIRGLSKPKITDNEAWWCGRNRIMSFTTWQDALTYWDRFQIKEDVIAMDASVLKRKIFPSESDFYFKD